MTGEHLDRLLETLLGDDGMNRKRAREIITLIGEAATPALEPLLDHSDKRARWEATKTLAAVVDPDCVEAFVRLLDDPLPEIRWLAGTGLINLGPRSLAPVLTPLTRPPLSRGRAEMSHRVLRELSSDNDTLAGIVESVMTALDRRDTALVAPAAARALGEIERLTGRRPDQ